MKQYIHGLYKESCEELIEVILRMRKEETSGEKIKMLDILLEEIKSRISEIEISQDIYSFFI